MNVKVTPIVRSYEKLPKFVVSYIFSHVARVSDDGLISIVRLKTINKRTCQAIDTVIDSFMRNLSKILYTYQFSIKEICCFYLWITSGKTTFKSNEERNLVVRKLRETILRPVLRDSFNDQQDEKDVNDLKSLMKSKFKIFNSFTKEELLTLNSVLFCLGRCQKTELNTFCAELVGYILKENSIQVSGQEIANINHHCFLLTAKRKDFLELITGVYANHLPDYINYSFRDSFALKLLSILDIIELIECSNECKVEVISKLIQLIQNKIFRPYSELFKEKCLQIMQEKTEYKKELLKVIFTHCPQEPVLKEIFKK